MGPWLAWEWYTRSHRRRRRRSTRAVWQPNTPAGAAGAPGRLRAADQQAGGQQQPAGMRRAPARLCVQRFLSIQSASALHLLTLVCVPLVDHNVLEVGQQPPAGGQASGRHGHQQADGRAGGQAASRQAGRGLASSRLWAAKQAREGMQAAKQASRCPGLCPHSTRMKRRMALHAGWSPLRLERLAPPSRQTPLHSPKLLVHGQHAHVQHVGVGDEQLGLAADFFSASGSVGGWGGVGPAILPSPGWRLCLIAPSPDRRRAPP